MKTNTLIIGADHAGFEMKENIKSFLENTFPGIKVTDAGTYSADSVDYPDFAHKVAVEIAKSGDGLRGLLLCGSGNGVCITANRHQGVRAALCWTPEIAKLARQHNNANVLCIPSRFVTLETATQMLSEFLNTPFEGGRHERRMEKIEL
jgi:ribose 5-phosphate isomerase B